MTESGVRVRAARADEAEVLFRVQRASALAGFAHIFEPALHPFPDDEERERWSSYVTSSDIEVLVAEDDRVVVGVAVVNVLTLERLFVPPERWGMGIGSLGSDSCVISHSPGPHDGE